PQRSARSSSSWPAWALKKITGIFGLVCFRHRCSCKPSRFGMRTSRIRQEASVTCPEFSKPAPEKNASPRMPNERMSLQVELATDGSSSTTITRVDSIGFAFGATVVINLVALRGKVLLSFGTGERLTVRVLESRWGGRMHVIRPTGLSYPRSGDRHC